MGGDEKNLQLPIAFCLLPLKLRTKWIQQNICLTIMWKLCLEKADQMTNFLKYEMFVAKHHIWSAIASLESQNQHNFSLLHRLKRFSMFFMTCWALTQAFYFLFPFCWLLNWIVWLHAVYWKHVRLFFDMSQEKVLCSTSDWQGNFGEWKEKQSKNMIASTHPTNPLL